MTFLSRHSMLNATAAFLFFVAATVFSSQSVAQTTLWDQAPDPDGDQIINQNIPGAFSDFSTFLVSDVTFSQNVIIDSVTSYYSNSTGTWTSTVTSGILNIFDGDALTTLDDPLVGGDFGPGATSVSVTVVEPGVLAVTASGLNISLQAGDYFFGLAASEPDPDNQEFQLEALTSFGQESFLRNPAGGFGPPISEWVQASVFGFPGYEGAITITAVPEPSSCMVFAVGSVCLLVRRKR